MSNTHTEDLGNGITATATIGRDAAGQPTLTAISVQYDATPPAGGLRATDLRAVNLGAVRAAALAALSESVKDETVTALFDRWVRSPSDEWYQSLATEYNRLVAAGSKQPVAALVRMSGRGNRFVQARIYEAGKRGLITRGPNGASTATPNRQNQ